TGDRSGDWLFGSLYRNGLAKIAISVDRNDGQELPTSRIACAVRCAPPDNKPSTEEKAICAPWLHREMELLFPTLKSILVLGNFAWGATISALTALGETMPKPTPKFGHGANFKFKGKDGATRLVIASYHPSQQNTFTGKLTEKQLDLVIKKAGRFAQLGTPS
nr:uracil-DNA glycosylase [Actinomycetota bacterium]